jgi:mannan endo-1,4-beta-mannosidase
MKICKRLLCIFFIVFICQTAVAQRYLIKRSKKGIVSYLKACIAGRRVIVGQHCGNGAETAQGFQDYVEGLHDKSSKYPALIGLEYGFSKGNDLTFINKFALKHWQRGGLVTISWHADNPWVAGYNPRYDAAANKDSIDLNALISNAPESEAKTNYRNELKKVALGLLELKKAGVTVLWRPFHEMNGSWFWWGANDKNMPTNVESYKLLWQDMYNYFTNVMGLNNLVWIYCPNAGSKSMPSVLTFYPGTRYVDVVGVDNYSVSADFMDYYLLKTLKKPIVIGEVGPRKEVYGRFSESNIIKAFKGKAAYFLQWSSWSNAKVAIVDNDEIGTMMSDPAAITLDKMKP